MVFLGLFGVTMAQMFGLGLWPGKAGWLEALLLLAAAVSTLVSLARQLPAQNVWLGATIIALLGSLIQAIGVLTGIPFGSYRYTEAAGPRLFGVLPWFVPLVWIVAILNARGVARLILRPGRKNHRYGYWLLGLTAGLCVGFDLGLELFAARVKGYWMWKPTRLPVTWHEIPLANSLGWALGVILILAFATPALINKSPAQIPPVWHPLMVWTLLNGLLVIVEFRNGFQFAAVMGAALTAITIFLAWRGARRGSGIADRPAV